jgi:hypothetical protein
MQVATETKTSPIIKIGLKCMDLHNLKISRIVIHQVFQRDSDGSFKKPISGSELINFDQSATDEFIVRVTQALGAGSKAVEMEIVDRDAESLPSLVELLVGMDDADFVVSSYDIARKLAAAQQRKNIPGGIVVVFSGTYGAHSRDFLGVIKADVHSGYKRSQDALGKITLEFIKELLLTPASKLYKTAAFLHHGNDEEGAKTWRVLVSDSQINQTDGKAAAEYFYRDFLGCDYLKTSALTTKKFYDSTREFISELDVSEEDKSDYYTALTTYLKVDNSNTISVENFASTYFNEVDLQDDFATYMKDKGIPDKEFTKDIAHIKNKLKLRRLSFKRNIRITAPAEEFKNLISFETIDAEDAGEEGKQWTKVIIKDLVVDQE